LWFLLILKLFHLGFGCSLSQPLKLDYIQTTLKGDKPMKYLTLITLAIAGFLTAAIPSPIVLTDQAQSRHAILSRSLLEHRTATARNSASETLIQSLTQSLRAKPSAPSPLT
jgi:hypothetical protein